MITQDAYQIQHDDGTHTDYVVFHFDGKHLKLLDVDQADAQGKLADIAHYRMVKAKGRGIEAPVTVSHGVLSPDLPAKGLFPDLELMVVDGETLLSANSTIHATMRTLFREGWICFADGSWSLAIPEQQHDWQKRGEAVLSFLVDQALIYLLTSREGDIDFGEVAFDVDLDLMPVGGCTFLKRFVEAQSPQLVFNTAYFLLEPEDIFSHHSVLCEAHSFWMKEGVIERPPLFQRGVIWQAAGGDWAIDKIGLEEIGVAFANGLRLVHHRYSEAEGQICFGLNDEVRKHPVHIYSRYYGVSSAKTVLGITPRDPDRVELTLIDRRVVGLKRGGGLSIPHNGIVLSFSADVWQQKVGIADTLNEDIYVNYFWAEPLFQAMEQGLQTGPTLLLHGESPLTNRYLEDEEQFWPSRIDADGIEQPGVVSTKFKTDVTDTRAGRIGLGIDSEGQLIAVLAPGVNSGYGVAGTDSFGATFLEMVTALQKAGAISALNLDGGGSTQAYFQGQRAVVPGDRRRVHHQIYERMIPSVGVIEE